MAMLFYSHGGAVLGREALEYGTDAVSMTRSLQIRVAREPARREIKLNECSYCSTRGHHIGDLGLRMHLGRPDAQDAMGRFVLMQD